MVVEVASNKPSGAPWDADGSPPETAFALWFGERKISFQTRSGYSTGGAIVGGLVHAGTSVTAGLVDRDAMFDDPIASITDIVPDTLERGVWSLVSGGTSVTLRGRCVE